MMLPTIDSDGFISGSIAESAVSVRNAYMVVHTPVPEGPLPPIYQWRWDGTAWGTQISYLGHSWYNPENTDQVYTPTNAADVPPADWIYWEPGQNKVVPAAQRLAKARKEKWVAIKAARDAAEFEPLTWDGSVFDADAVSQDRLKGALQLSGIVPDFATDWTLKDNSIRTLNGSDLVQIGIVIGVRLIQHHERSRMLRKQISTANEQQIELIVW